MDYNVNNGSGVTEVTLKGTMTFSDHLTFRAMLKELTMPEGHRVVFNLSALDSIDSSGLGMFLIANEEAGKRGLKLSLHRPKPNVKRLMDMAKFNRVVEIAS